MELDCAEQYFHWTKIRLRDVTAKSSICYMNVLHVLMTLAHSLNHDLNPRDELKHKNVRTRHLSQVQVG